MFAFHAKMLALGDREKVMSRWEWILSHVSRRLWVRTTLIGMLGVLGAVLAAVAEHYVPWEIPGSIAAEAVDDILNIIASSMLAVTTFSLSVMVSAYSSATSNVSPRATRLLMEDKVTLTVLSTFIGSFLFSMVGLVALKTGAYGDRGRVILFIMTIGVIVLIVVSLLRWIDHLTGLGRVGETTERVEQAARQAILDRTAAPFLGGTPLRDPNTIPASAEPLTLDLVGYVQHIDVAALQHSCAHHGGEIYIAALPGTFIYPHTPLAWFSPKATIDDAPALREALCRAFSIGRERSFEQDPRFGLAVLSEAASRALSPGVNDPGTAIDVIGRMTRLLCLLTRESVHPGQSEVAYPAVHVPPLTSHDLFEDAFMLIARDGAGLIEIQLRLQKSLHALAQLGDSDFREAARYQARLALARATAVLTLDADRQRLDALGEALDA